MAAKKKTDSLATAAGTLGKKGGPARAAVLTPARRSAIAREGGVARQRGSKKKG